MAIVMFLIYDVNNNLMIAFDCCYVLNDIKETVVCELITRFFDIE